MTPQFKKTAHKSVQTERALVSASRRSSSDALMLRDRDRQRRFALNNVTPSCFVLIVRHIAEHAARFGCSLSLVSVICGWRASCIVLLHRRSAKRRTTLNALIASAGVFERLGCFTADWS